jgi:hypothetical protein
MQNYLLRLFWQFYLSWLESRIRDRFDRRLSLAIDRATVRVEKLEQ